MKKKIEILKENIINNINIYRCPLCGENFRIEQYGMVCTNRHTFDIASKGYVNFFKRPSKITEVYDKGLFLARKNISDAGIYDKLCDKINLIAAEHISLRREDNNISQDGNIRPLILDAGAGGGNITVKTADFIHEALYAAMDLSKEAVEFASTNYFRDNIFWIIGNLNDIPLADNSVDIILNIMSPANYGEFKRTLKNGGILIKVLIEADYLKEVRNFIYADNDNQKYSNAEVFDHIQANMPVADAVTVSYTHSVRRENLASLFDMTPLTKNIPDRENVKNKFVGAFDTLELSLAFKIIICKKQ